MSIIKRYFKTSELSPLTLNVMKEAVCSGQLEAVQTLLESGFDVNHKYPNGSTLLHYAARNKQNEIIQLLLENQSLVEEFDNNELRAVDYSVLNGDREIFRIFLNNGSTYFIDFWYQLLPQVKDDEMYKLISVLHNIYEGKSAALQQLREIQREDYQIIVNASNSEDLIILAAIESKQKEIVYQLMKMGCPKNKKLEDLEKIKNSVSNMIGGIEHLSFDYKQNQYFTISENDNLNILLHFLTNIERELQKFYKNLLLLACKLNNFEMVKYWIKRARRNLNKHILRHRDPGNFVLCLEEIENTNYDEKDLRLYEKARSILLYNASYELLRKKIINCIDLDGSTPLHIAVGNGNLDIVLLLLKYGANYCLTNNKNETPVLLSQDYKITEIFDTIENYSIHSFSIRWFRSLRVVDSLAILNAQDNNNESIILKLINYFELNVIASLIRLIRLDENITEPNLYL